MYEEINLTFWFHDFSRKIILQRWTPQSLWMKGGRTEWMTYKFHLVIKPPYWLFCIIGFSFFLSSTFFLQLAFHIPKKKKIWIKKSFKELGTNLNHVI